MRQVNGRPQLRPWTLWSSALYCATTRRCGARSDPARRSVPSRTSTMGWLRWQHAVVAAGLDVGRGVDRPAADHDSELSAHATCRVGIVAVRRGDRTDAGGGPVRPRCGRSGVPPGAEFLPGSTGSCPTDPAWSVPDSAGRPAPSGWAGGRRWWLTMLASSRDPPTARMNGPGCSGKRCRRARSSIHLTSRAGRSLRPPRRAADHLRRRTAMGRRPAPHLADAAPRAPRAVRLGPSDRSPNRSHNDTE